MPLGQKHRAIALVLVLLLPTVISCGQTIVPPSRTARTSTATPSDLPLETPTPVPTPNERPSDTPSPTPSWPSQPSDGRETALRLAHTTVPPRDLVAITSRLQRGGAPLSRTAAPDPRPFTIGRQDRFWISDPALDRQREITATLRWITPHLYLYVENGREVPLEALRRAGQFFEEEIYPGHHAHFGSEWNPGVDNDPHLVILHAVFDGAAGYFSSLDEVPRTVNPNSNEHEMFYMNLDEFDVGEPAYLSTLAHEFQHMIAAHQDPNLDAWADEGLAQMGEELTGLGGDSLVFFYLFDTDVQLTTWSDDEHHLAHYGASFLWLRYLMDRLGGPEVLRQLYDPTADTLTTIDSLLQHAGYRPVVQAPRPFDAFFADWAVANYLNDPAVADGRYAYAPDYDKPEVFQGETIWHLPWETRTTVSPYGVDYYFLEAEGEGTLRIAFGGVRSLPLIAAAPHSGSSFWWSNRGDVSNTYLMRRFDLSGVDRATLRYWTWYDIETDYDYAYVEASSDGRSWTTLPAPGTTTTNPNGNNLGHGYTGLSGDGPRWVREEVDLSAYAGRPVWVRFELVTDDAINRPGLALDDIEIPEIGFFDDAETDGDWEAAGFVRVDNFVPAHFVVQLLTQDAQGRWQVRAIPLDEERRGTAEVEGFGDLRRLVLVVTAMAPATTEPAVYELGMTLE